VQTAQTAAVAAAFYEERHYELAVQMCAVLF